MCKEVSLLQRYSRNTVSQLVSRKAWVRLDIRMIMLLWNVITILSRINWLIIITIILRKNYIHPLKNLCMFITITNARILITTIKRLLRHATGHKALIFNLRKVHNFECIQYCPACILISKFFLKRPIAEQWKKAYKEVRPDPVFPLDKNRPCREICLHDPETFLYLPSALTYFQDPVHIVIKEACTYGIKAVIPGFLLLWQPPCR